MQGHSGRAVCVCIVPVPDGSQMPDVLWPAEQRVALCLTVLNEADNLAALFGSIVAQTRLPDEIIIVDGGSSDGTAELAWEWEARGLPISLLVQPGANIAMGRNLAIAHAQSPIIAVTDARRAAGSRLAGGTRRAVHRGKPAGRGRRLLPV